MEEHDAPQYNPFVAQAYGSVQSAARIDSESISSADRGYLSQLEPCIRCQ